MKEKNVSEACFSWSTIAIFLCGVLIAAAGIKSLVYPPDDMTLVQIHNHVTIRFIQAVVIIGVGVFKWIADKPRN